MPKLEYPAYFSGGLLGTKVTQDIGYREAYLAVPYKMMISVTKAKAHPVIGPILSDHIELINDRDQMILAFFLFHELTQGRDSYWYPYLRIMPEIQSLSDWKEFQIEMLQDESFVLYQEEQALYDEMIWHDSLTIIQQYPNVFPEKFVDKDLFMNLYFQVCTRCYSSGTESTSMIPMADNLNHNCVDINQEMISAPLHFNQL